MMAQEQGSTEIVKLLEEHVLSNYILIQAPHPITQQVSASRNSVTSKQYSQTCNFVFLYWQATKPKYELNADGILSLNSETSGLQSAMTVHF